MKNIFRVLLIDDTKEVLDNLKAILEQDISIEGLSVKIVVVTLHVIMEELPNNQGYQITKETIDSLGKICENKFDYIFSDFGFIGDKARNENLRKELLSLNQHVKSRDIAGFVLQLRDIKTRFEELRNNNEIDNIAKDNIIDNFINHSGNVLVYTNSPEPFDNYFNMSQMPIRRNEVKNVFQNANLVEFILMHDEFSITPEIDNLFADINERKNFYALLLSKKIDSLLQFAALRHMVESQGKLRVRNAKKAFQKLTAWGIGFGAAVALFGEVIFHFLHKTFEIIMERLHLEFDKNFWVNILATISIILIAWKIFPYLGIQIAKKTEIEIDHLLEK